MLSCSNIIKETIFILGSITNTMELLNNCNSQKDVMSEEQTDITSISEMGIVFSNIYFKHNDRYILENANVHFENAKVSVVLGKIGSGKSTMIDLIMKYKLPNRGTIYIDGESISDMSTAELRKKLGYVQQNPILFDRTLYENLAYGLDSVSKEDVNNAIDKLELTSFFNSTFKDGLETVVGNKGSKLSGGQKQIMSIIRIYLMNPSYVLMDEPTSSLDKDTRVIVNRLLKVFANRYSMIIISHDHGLLEIADNIYIMKDGNIVKYEK
jgi:ABC-type multidrug transport system fused ATPase/permease subunit